MQKMLSCAVKTCVNASMDVRNNYNRVTFHSFPQDKSWQNKWIKIIRACRNEELWVPSESSVICSEHFDEGDFYTTQFGNRLIVKNAVPKLNLYDDRTGDSEIITSDRIDNVVIKVEDEGTDDIESEIMVNQIQKFISKVPSVQNPINIIAASSSFTFIDPLASQVQNVSSKVLPTQVPINPIATPSSFILIDPLDPQIQNIISEVPPTQKPINPIAETSSCASIIEPFVPQQNTQTEERPIAHYKHEIKKKNEQLKICRSKIKILHQKVHRIQMRNQKLKNILKAIKDKKLIHKSIFKELTADLDKNDK